MKKKLVILMMICLCLFGCGKKVNTPREISKDTVLFSLQNCNLNFYTQLGGATYIPFELISAQELDGSNLSLAIDINTPYRWSIDYKKEIEELPYYVYQNYQDVDWDKICQLDMDTYGDDGLPNVEAVEIYNDYRNSYLDPYKKFREKMVNLNCYYYSGAIAFDFADMEGCAENESFSEITFTVNNQEYRFDIGNIELNYTLAPPETSSALQANIFSAIDKPVFPNKQGVITLDNILSCIEDVYITGFRLLNLGAEIQEVSLAIEENGNPIDLLFSGKPIFCKKGSTIKPKITVSDSNFKDQLFYSSTYHVMIDYEYNGKEYSEFFQMNYRTRYGFHELVAMLYDDIDFLPYFYKYYSVIGEEN